MPEALFETTVTATRAIGAPREALWALWTTPAWMRAWWGASEDCELFDCVTEAQPGGALRYAMRPRGGGAEERVAGVFDLVEPPARLGFTWVWQGSAERVDTHATVTFEADGAATRVTVTHRGQPSARVAAIHRQGWADMLADLDRAATAAMPTPSLRDTLAALWWHLARRDWEGAGSLLAEDAVVTWPHSGETFRGRDAFVAVNAAYPGQWEIALLRAEGTDTGAVAVAAVSDDARRFHAVSFAAGEPGRIASLTEYWSEAGAPPAWRSPRRTGSGDSAAPSA
jgi:uncharacterized protein YndB with AHSA1/START domain